VAAPRPFVGKFQRFRQRQRPDLPKAPPRMTYRVSDSTDLGARLCTRTVGGSFPPTSLAAPWQYASRRLARTCWTTMTYRPHDTVRVAPPTEADVAAALKRRRHNTTQLPTAAATLSYRITEHSVVTFPSHQLREARRVDSWLRRQRPRVIAMRDCGWEALRSPPNRGALRIAAQLTTRRMVAMSGPPPRVGFRRSERGCGLGALRASRTWCPAALAAPRLNSRPGRRLFAWGGRLGRLGLGVSRSLGVCSLRAFLYVGRQPTLRLPHRFLLTMLPATVVDCYPKDLGEYTILR
jgi:hypothetical protein